MRERARRTAWWRRYGRRTVPGAPRTALRPGLRALRTALMPGLCSLLLLPCGTAAAHGNATATEKGAPQSYAFTPGARTVAGATGTATAPRLDAGRTYRSSLSRNGKLYYRLELGATDTAYVPVTAVPPAHSTVSATDGITVSLQDATGTPCSFANARFGAGLSPRPVTALGQRETGKAVCQGRGTYYVVVRRLDAQGPGTTAPAQPWDLEIAPVTEPRTAQAGATSAPQAWDSATPEPLTGEPRDRSGGTGFASASPLGQGVWRTSLVPGETRFYKVPLDWGRQLHASAELGSATGHGYVGGALNLSLYNPVRGYVEDAALGYTGTQKAAVLAPLPPVEYANRYAVPTGVTSVRFAGDYYLVLHLSEQTADSFGPGPFAVTLRVRVAGRAHTGPQYDGRPVPGEVFTVSGQDRETALTGNTGDGADPVMRLVAISGIGLGTALLLMLAGWTVTARTTRRTQTRVNAQKPTA